MLKPSSPIARTVVVAAAIAGFGAMAGFAVPDAAMRAGFKAAGAEVVADWGDDAGSLRPVTAGEREARLWLGRDTPLTARLGHRIVRLGDRITIAGADGLPTAFDVHAIKQLDGLDGASGRPLLIVDCRPVDDAHAAPVRLMLEASDEPARKDRAL